MPGISVLIAIFGVSKFPSAFLEDMAKDPRLSVIPNTTQTTWRKILFYEQYLNLFSNLKGDLYWDIYISSKPRNLYSVFGVQIIYHSFKMINLFFPLNLYTCSGARKDVLKPIIFFKLNLLG